MPPSPIVLADTQSLYDKFADYLPHLGLAVAILLVGWWLAGQIKKITGRVLHARHVDVTLSSFLMELFYWLMIAVVVITTLGKAGLETTSVVTVLGASTLAVGLALQSSLSNFAAGVMIILFRHFRVGDSIEAAGVAGVVEEISIFDTHLITADNRKIIVPNGKILGAPITNASAKPTRRLDLVFRISYDSDLKRAKEIILAALQADVRVLPVPPPVVAVDNLCESSVNLSAQAWVGIGDYDGLRSSTLETVKLRFDEASIIIPYPQRDVRVRTEK